MVLYRPCSVGIFLLALSSLYISKASWW